MAMVDADGRLAVQVDGLGLGLAATWHLVGIRQTGKLPQWLSGAGTKLILNLLIRFHLNIVTNRHQLTAHSTTWDIMPYNTVMVDYCDVTSPYVYFMDEDCNYNVMSPFQYSKVAFSLTRLHTFERRTRSNASMRTLLKSEWNSTEKCSEADMTKAPSTPKTMLKQHCRMLQVERFFRQSRMLLRRCCWCGRGLITSTDRNGFG